MTKLEMEARYQSAVKDIEAQKRLGSARSYAAGAAILLYTESKGFENAGVFARLLLVVLGLFAAFYLTTQI